MKSTTKVQLNVLASVHKLHGFFPLLGAKSKLEMEVTRLTAQRVALEVKR